MRTALRVIGFIAALCAAGCGFKDGPIAGGTTTETEALIMGVVRKSDGSVAVGARMRLRPADYLSTRPAEPAGEGDSLTDSLGRFRFNPEEKGLFYLEADIGDSLGLLVRNVSPGKESRKMECVLGAVGSVRLTVLDLDSGAAYAVRAVGLERYQVPDSAGAFRLTLPAGDHRLVITGGAKVLPLVLDSVHVEGGKETRLDSLRFPALDSALLGYWPFEEGAGESAADASGNGRSAAMKGTEWAAGREGGALKFTKGQGYVDAGVKEPDDLAFATDQDFTFAAWAKVGNPVPNRGVARRIISKQKSGAYGFFLRVFPDGRPGFGSNPVKPAKRSAAGSAAAVPTRDLIANENVADGAWHHLAGISRKGRLEIYVDGKLRISALNDSIKSVSTFTDYNDKSPLLYPDPGLDGHLTIGCVLSGVDGFDGLIDEARVYGRALTPPEVLQLAKPMTAP